ncbi:MAG: tyrosine-type recombinase/integrase [Kurthia sp.]|nr:tyrosine-type recombinase/integrase [Candidatus Kurthia equi]
MYFQQLEKNKWIAKADGPRDHRTGKRKQVTRRGKTKKEAEKRVLLALDELENNNLVDSDITFEELAGKYIEVLKFKGLKNSTIQLRKYSIGLLNQYFAKARVKNISTTMYQNMLNKYSTHYSHNSLIAMNSIANMIFKYGLRLEIINKSPVTNAFIPKKSKLVDYDEEIQNKYFSKQELKRFLNEVDNLKDKVAVAYYYTLAFTGMRPGELLALQKKDINLVHKEIKINKTLEFESYDNYTLTPPKTVQSNRSVLVDDYVIDKIKEMYQFQKDNKFKNSNFALHNSNGQPLRRRTLNAAIKSICKRAEIDKDANTYMLRHTHVSLLSEADVPLLEIAERVGHKNDKTTVAVYLHVTKNMKKRTSEKLHKKLTQILEND